VIKKIGLNLDAFIAIIVVFLLSFGFNLYQRFQYSDLMQEHLDTKWKALTMELNWQYAKGMLEQCQVTEGEADVSEAKPIDPE
jgi:hypothetical protein